MHTWIALFRGINVGGKNRLPMRELTQALEELGLVDVESYIQSGNVVFRSANTDARNLAARIADKVRERHGFEPRVFVLSARELVAAAASNPFPDAQSHPQTLHVYFLAGKPKRADSDALNELKADNESFAIVDGVFYLHAPDGVGRSKLANGAEKAIGVDATARNWRTVTKLIDLVRERE